MKAKSLFRDSHTPKSFTLLYSELSTVSEEVNRIQERREREGVVKGVAIISNSSGFSIFTCSSKSGGEYN